MRGRRDLDRLVEQAKKGRQLAIAPDQRSAEGRGRRARRAQPRGGTPGPRSPAAAWPCPSSSSVSGAAKRKSRRAADRVRSPARIIPGSAACSRRAATLTASPATIRCSGGPGRSDHLAGVHADPNLDRDVVPIEVDIELSEPRPHLERGVERACGVVLPHGWDAKDRHDGVTDVLLHGAAPRLDDCRHASEIRRRAALVT